MPTSQPRRRLNYAGNPSGELCQLFTHAVTDMFAWPLSAALHATGNARAAASVDEVAEVAAEAVTQVAATPEGARVLGALVVLTVGMPVVATAAATILTPVTAPNFRSYIGGLVVSAGLSAAARVAATRYHPYA